ncbi:TolC family protein [Candidatus Zixiibacteriota bacterium]
MKVLKSNFIIAVLLIIVFGLNANANELTLEDCIELALKNRYSIISARGMEDLAKAGKSAALGAFLPSVSASYNYSKGKETDIEPGIFRPIGDPVTVLDTTTINGQTAIDAVSVSNYELVEEQDIGPSKSLSVSANMWLFNLENFYSLAQANASKEAASLDVINSEQDLIFAVKLSYYTYLASVEKVEVEEEAVKRSEEQLKLINSRYELGSASLSDVLKQKVLFGNDQLALLTANNSVVTTKASLAYTIGLNPNSDIEFSKNYNTKEYEGSLEEAISFSFENEPGLQSSMMNSKAASKAVKATLSNYLPRLSGSASFTKFNGTQAYPTAFDYSSINKRYGFTVSWNIFDGFQRERAVTSAKVNRNNARAWEAETKNLVIRDVKTAYFEIEQQKQANQIAQDNVEAANEDMKITQEKYNLGAATILDLLNAQESLKRAQVDLIRRGFDLNLAIAKLENAMGKK